MVAVCLVFGARRERELLHAGWEDAALVVGYLKLWRGVDDGMGGGELVVLTRGRDALSKMSTQDEGGLASEGKI